MRVLRRAVASGRSMDPDVGVGATCGSRLVHLPGQGKTEVGTWLRPTEGLGPEPARQWSEPHDKSSRWATASPRTSSIAPMTPLVFHSRRRRNTETPSGLRYSQWDHGSDTSQAREHLYHPRRLSWVVTEPAVSPQRQWPRALARCTPGPRRISSPRWIAFEHSPPQPCCALATTGRASQRWRR